MHDSEAYEILIFVALDFSVDQFLILTTQKRGPIAALVFCMPGARTSYKPLFEALFGREQAVWLMLEYLHDIF